MTLIEHVPALQIVVPLIAAPVCLLLRRPTSAWVAAVIANVIALVCAWQLVSLVRDGSIFRYALGGWSAPSGIEFYIDIVNASVLLIVSVVSLVTLLYSKESCRKSIASDKLYLLYTAWMLCLCGLMGMVITGDAFNVFVFLEISSLSTYMLISLGRERMALTAAFRYLVMGSIGASFILIGIGYLYAATGTLNMVDLAARIGEVGESRTVLIAFSFLTIGLMIKAAIFPLHGWLANAYTHAPIAVTAFLAGTATKVSLYVLLRFFYNIFGPEYSFGQMLLSYVLLPASVAGFLIMSLVAVFQSDLRRMLAYSSVAQIGYIVAAFSMASHAGLTAGIVHIFNHALIKAALFMSIGCMIYRYGHAHKTSLNLLIKTMPVTVLAFIISGLSLIGVPLTAGFISKFSLISAALAHDWWWVAAMILISSLMATIYISRAAEVMLFDKGRNTEPEPSGIDEAPMSMLIPMWVMIIVSIYVGVNGSATLEIAGAAASSLMDGMQ